MGRMGGELPTTNTSEALVLKGWACSNAVYVGAYVRYYDGEFINSQADAFETSIVIGVVERKPTTVTCDVRMSGTTGPIFSGLIPGAHYFLSATTPGGIEDEPPSGPGHIPMRVGQALTGTRMLLHICRPNVFGAT